MLDKLSKFEERDIPVLNDILRKLDDEKWQIRYVIVAPTTATMSLKEIVILDDGTTRRLYIKTGKGTLGYITITI